VVLVWLNKVEVGTKTLGESVVAVELKLGTNDGVTTGALGSKTGVISTSSSLVVLGKVDWSIVVGTSSTTGGKVSPSYLGGSLRSVGKSANILVSLSIYTGEGNSRIT